MVTQNLQNLEMKGEVSYITHEEWVKLTPDLRKQIECSCNRVEIHNSSPKYAPHVEFHAPKNKQTASCSPTVIIASDCTPFESVQNLSLWQRFKRSARRFASHALTPFKSSNNPSFWSLIGKYGIATALMVVGASFLDPFFGLGMLILMPFITYGVGRLAEYLEKHAIHTVHSEQKGAVKKQIEALLKLEILRVEGIEKTRAEEASEHKLSLIQEAQARSLKQEVEQGSGDTISSLRSKLSQYKNQKEELGANLCSLNEAYALCKTSQKFENDLNAAIKTSQAYREILKTSGAIEKLDNSIKILEQKLRHCAPEKKQTLPAHDGTPPSAASPRLPSLNQVKIF